jgi:Protein of unknown function (DUF732)
MDSANQTLFVLSSSRKLPVLAAAMGRTPALQRSAQRRARRSEGSQMMSAEVIDAGYQTCSELKGGTSVLDEMTDLEQRYHVDQGTLFVSAATTHLCPDFAAG